MGGQNHLHRGGGRVHCGPGPRVQARRQNHLHRGGGRVHCGPGHQGVPSCTVAVDGCTAAPATRGCPRVHSWTGPGGSCLIMWLHRELQRGPPQAPGAHGPSQAKPSHPQEVHNSHPRLQARIPPFRGRQAPKTHKQQKSHPKATQKQPRSDPEAKTLVTTRARNSIDP